MRKTAGIVILIAGLGGLGWYSAAFTAKDIEAQISQTARSAAPPGMEIIARAGGRDVIASGMVRDENMREELKAYYETLEGVRVADVSGVNVLPNASPFTLNAALNSEGDLTVHGTISDIEDRAKLETLAAATDVEIYLANGAPDDQFGLVAYTATSALKAYLVSGELSLIDRDLAITGVARTPIEAEALQNALAALHDNYTASLSVTVLDDGKPFRLVAENNGEEISLTGKLPADIPNSIAALLGTDTDHGIEISALSSASSNWPALAEAAISALNMLDTGRLTIDDMSLMLSGIGTQEALQEAENQLSGFSALFDLQLDLQVRPQNPAPGSEIENEIAPADEQPDILPDPDWRLTYRPETGSLIEGDLPQNLTLEQIRTALGGAQISGSPQAASLLDDPETVEVSLRAISSHLPHIDELGLQNVGQTIELSVRFAPGVDLDLVALDLAERLPGRVTLSITPTNTPPRAGTVRNNVATGQEEQFTGGFWLPIVTFEASFQTCTELTRNTLADFPITFLSASARLDALALRGINALAAIALECERAGFSMELVGHTDNTGDPFDNQALSLARAQTVRAALIDRGLQGESLSAFGLGATQPIETNDTAEGRAANRRTQIIWYPPGTLREP